MRIERDYLEIIFEEFINEISEYTFKILLINENEKVIVIEDDFILFIKKIYSFPQLRLEELTYNTVNFKFCQEKFKRKLKEKFHIDYIPFIYLKYAGYYRNFYHPTATEYTGISSCEYVHKKVPMLNLKERYENWGGLLYFIIVFEVLAKDDNLGIGIFYTTQKPYTYIQNKAKKWIELSWEEGTMNMIYPFKWDKNIVYKYHLEEALKSHGFSTKSKIYSVERQKILEQYLKYFYFEDYFREKDDAHKFARELLLRIIKGEFKDINRYSYSRPRQKWVTEELVYKLVKKIYKNRTVIHQYRPYWLRTPNGGQMSYDIYIPVIKTAIEYQGQQHFEPVDFFGGNDNFRKTVERDRIKKEISKEQGINLIYINYWENVTEELIKQKINHNIVNEKNN